MAKRNTVRGDGLDRISGLPDDVLVKILSLIPTDEAVATSFMSKRWKSLWTLLPHLDFDFIRFSRKFNAMCSDDDRKRRFLDFVEHVFFRRGIQPLRMLRLAFGIVQFDNYTSKASLLVKSAMRSDCFSIDLDFSSRDSLPIFPRYFNEMYTMPPCFFPHPSVSQLKLTSCKFVPSFYKSFTSVTVVKFTKVQLQKDSVYDLVSKCPALLELHLIYCQLLSSVFELIAPESNLKSLVMQDCCGNGGLFFKDVSIHIPNLSQFKFEGSFTSGHLSIHNSENLTEADIDIMYSPIYEHKSLLCKLLKDLQNVKSLTLSSSNLLMVLSTNGGESNLLSSFYNLKHLSVKLRQGDKELPGLLCLLRSSPYLETLSVDFHSGFETDDKAFCNVDDEAVRQPHLLPSECVAHLKKIKIRDFQGVKVEMEFVKIILQSSLCLKELVICINSRYRYLKLRLGDEQYKALKKKNAKTIERLMACDRASPGAQILIK